MSPAGIRPSTVPTSTTEATAQDTSNAPGNLFFGFLAAVAALILGTYAAIKFKTHRNQNQKEEKKGSRCLNIKKLLEKKLEELTDLRGQIENAAKEKVREGIREGVSGTRTGNLLAKIESAEKEYARLKKLLEDCIAKFGGSRRVLIVGPSLSGKTTLVRHLRSTTSLPVEEMDELLVAANNGTYPKDVAYRKDVLRPKIVKEVLEKENIVFFTNTDYFTKEDLNTARAKGFKIAQLTLPPETMHKRNAERMEKESYEDQSEWFGDMLSYQEQTKHLADRVVSADQPLEKIVEELGFDPEKLRNRKPADR
ncbi:MAG: hypothetical protein AAB495_01470 [Patescibacteria group bacterium]